MKYQATILDRLSLYSRSLSPAIARPLDVITGIEQTEHDLRIEILALTEAMSAGEKIIQLLPDIVRIIPDSLIEELEQHQEKLRERYHHLKNNKSVITRHCTEHDELPDLLDDAINILHQAFDQAEQLRWAAFEHNTDLEPEGESRILTTPEAVKQELAAWR